MRVGCKLIRVLGLDQYTAYVFDVDGRTLHQLTRWSEAYARRDALQWAAALARGWS